MPSTFTPNIGLEMPSTGSYNDTWGPVADNVFMNVDTVLGSVTTINVTGIAAGTYTLSLTQYQPRNIEVVGTAVGTIVYSLPQGVGGTWSFFNNTSGSGSVYFGNTGQNILVRQGFRSLLTSDGANMQFADTDFASIVAGQAQTAAETYAAAQASAAQTAAEAYASSVAGTAQSTAEAYAASQASAAQAAAISSSNTYAAAQASSAQTTAENYSKGTSGPGWQVLPSGKVMMWGVAPGQSASPLTVTFPRSGGFPTACESIIITPINASGSYDTSAPSASTTSFVINFGVSGTPFSWVAFGS